MKFFAFTDVHEDLKFLKKIEKRVQEKDIDFVITCGDFTIFEHNLGYMLKRLNAFGKKVFLVPGNHEDEEHLGHVSEVFPNCVNIHGQMVQYKGITLCGWGTGGFAQEEPRLRKVAREWLQKLSQMKPEQKEKMIFVTHAPPYKTKLDALHGRHVGNIDIRKFIERAQPTLALSGHLHENAGVEDILGKTRLINPGWEGKVVEI